MIELPRFEINVVDHCNMRCRGCNHMSPVMPKSFADPAEVVADLSFLAPMLHAGIARIVGGEPLIHPAIDLILEAVRASGIADQVQVVTNGVCLGEMSQAFWSMIDQVVFSKYPGVEASWPSVYSSKVTVEPTDTFMETFAVQKNPDEDLVRKIWDKCGIRNVCFGLVNRHFFKCMRSGFIPRAVGAAPMVDGFSLQGMTEKMLLGHIRSTEPLESCRYCTGTSGKRFPHQELPIEEWSLPHLKPVAELLDPAR